MRIRSLRSYLQKRIGDSRRKDFARVLVEVGLSIVKVCLLTLLSRSTFYRVRRNWLKFNADVILVISAVLKKSPYAGFWKCVAQIRNKGLTYNHKRIYRVYCSMGFNLSAGSGKSCPRAICKRLQL